MVHHWFGRVVLLAAVANTFLGIWAVAFSGVLLYVLYAVFLAVVLVLIIWLERRLRNEPAAPIKEECSERYSCDWAVKRFPTFCFRTRRDKESTLSDGK